MSENELKVVEPDSVAGETNGMIRMIEQVALNPDVPVEKMERMLAMQERIMDRQAEQEFTASMVRVQASMPYIKNDRENSQTRSTYATLDAINKVIKPYYTKEGFSLCFGTDGEVLPGTIRIICDVLHIGGHSKRYTYDSPIDDKGIKGSVNKTTTHARASGTSYGQRYITKMIFNLTLTDEDDDGNSAGNAYQGDVVAAFQGAKDKAELQTVWKQLNKAQQDQYINDLNSRLAEL